jgi:2-polyprenyl-6-methoxyphenol hydroxylase-like FAD-dependent oxidoreductase
MDDGRIVITGAGVVGLCTAMLLAKDGHDVTVLERDPAEPPEGAEAAWESWQRRGVNQFRLLHYFLPRFRLLAEAELPEVVAALEGIGALRFNPIKVMPEATSGGWQEADDRFEALTGRRPVVEAAIAAVAAHTPGVTIRRGVAVAGLDHNGDRHVTGIRTETGEMIPADLVIDATGRRSPLPAWLEAIGAPRPRDEPEDCGFVYYGRHFRSADGSIPPLLGPIRTDYGSFSVITLPADNGTWGVGVITSSRDRALRGLRDAKRWYAVVRSCPLVAHWVDAEPLEDHVVVMAKIEDRIRTFTIDGSPVATGIVAVADSWACTNPSLGRGVSIGLMHAVALRDLLRCGIDDPTAFAKAWSETTAQVAEPWYRATLAYDRRRLAAIDAAIDGRDEPADEIWELTRALTVAAGRDMRCLRALMAMASLLALPEEIFGDPELRDAVVSLGSRWREQGWLGPNREELLSIMAS